MTRLLRRIARWLTGHHPHTPAHPPPDPHTNIDPYGHVLPPRPRNTP